MDTSATALAARSLRAYTILCLAKHKVSSARTFFCIDVGQFSPIATPYSLHTREDCSERSAAIASAVLTGGECANIERHFAARRMARDYREI